MQEQIIRQKLEMLEKEFTGCYGLYNGKTGLALSYFLMGEITTNQYYLDKGQLLLDELSENILNVQGSSFHQGLSGIGWCVEWLVQNKFISANTDEILSDLDDELYKTVVYEKSSNISLYDGSIGKAMYFYKRWLAKHPGTPRSRLICNEECLVLLTDEICETLNIIKDNLPNIENSDNSHLISVCQGLMFLCKLVEHKINPETVGKSICHAIGLIEEELVKYESAGINNLEHIIYLIYAYWSAGLKLKDQVIARHAESLLLLHQSLNKPYLVKPYHVYIENKLLHHFFIQEDSHPQLLGHGNFKVLCEITMSSKFQKASWDEAWIL